MRLSGIQVTKIAAIADGGDITLTRKKEGSYVNVHRLDDGYKVHIEADGQETVLQESND